MMNLLAQFTYAAIAKALSERWPLAEDDAQPWLDAFVWSARWTLRTEREAAR